jgi:GT2 family glycosyltransferase
MARAEAHEPRPELTVVLSTLGNYEILARVLDGYERQIVAPGTFEMLVVSDRAEPDPDAVDATIGERQYPVRRLTGDIPGLSANRNTGWAAARAPIVLFTDNDTIPVPRLVAEHLRWHARHPEEEVAVAGHVRWAKGMKVTPFMKWLELGIQFDFRGVRNGEASWAQLYGANGSIKRTFLQRVGGYDEQRLPYLYEDLDWAYRAREHGLRVMFNRRAVVDHLKPASVENFQDRAPQLAAAEWHFSQLHPEVEPWFHVRFADVAGRDVGGSRAARAAPVVPRAAPRAGALVWERANLYWLKQIAPYFLAEWDRLASGASASIQPSAPALRERDASSAGS